MYHADLSRLGPSIAMIDHESRLVADFFTLKMDHCCTVPILSGAEKRFRMVRVPRNVIGSIWHQRGKVVRQKFSNIAVLPV